EIEGVDSGRVRSTRWERVAQGERLGARLGAAIQARVRLSRMETALRPVLGAGDEIVLSHGPRSSHHVLRTNLTRAVQGLEAVVVVGLVLDDDRVAEDIDDLPVAALRARTIGRGTLDAPVGGVCGGQLPVFGAGDHRRARRAAGGILEVFRRRAVFDLDQFIRGTGCGFARIGADDGVVPRGRLNSRAVESVGEVPNRLALLGTEASGDR